MAALKIISSQSDRQIENLISTLLETQKGREFNGIEAANFFRETWGIDADWHTYTEIMDYMARINQATCTKSDGMTRYLIGYTETK
jgi:hypothetical protein